VPAGMARYTDRISSTVGANRCEVAATCACMLDIIIDVLSSIHHVLLYISNFKIVIRQVYFKCFFIVFMPIQRHSFVIDWSNHYHYVQ